MNTHSSSHRGHRFPREIISQAVWLYHRFSLSLRDVEELLAKRGITLWRAVDQDGDVIDILVQRYRNARAAKGSFASF